MEKILTIIIPSYNMEEFISQSLNSLLIPSLNDVEILVINDGSKDKTSELANTYALKYHDSIRVIDKENGHYGSCVNRGLQEARGKYVKILDADDSFDSDGFEGFVRFLKGVNVDMVFSNYCIVNEKGSVTSEVKYPKPLHSGNMSFDEALPLINHRTIAMHAITYRLELLKSINYKQTEGVIYTDKEWDFMPLLHVKTVAAFPHCVYKYLVGRDGQSTSSEVAIKFENLSFELLLHRIDYFNQFKFNLSSSKIKVALDQLGLGISVIYYRDILRLSYKKAQEGLRNFDAKLKKISPEVYDYLNYVKLWKCVPYIRLWRDNNKFSLIVLNLVRKLIYK